MNTYPNYLEKAKKDYLNALGKPIEYGTVIHSGRQNTVIDVTDYSGTRSCMRYRTALEFWYEDCVKEPFVESLDVVDIPKVRFYNDKVKPQLLISEFVEGKLLHEIDVTPELAQKVGEAMVDYHISSNMASTYMDFIKGVKSSTTWVEDFISSLREEAEACGYSNSDIENLTNLCQTIFPNDTQERLVLVHNDLHFKNIIARPNGSVCIIDWDSTIIAPREKDFVKLLDWSHGNANTVPTIVSAYQQKSGYELNMDAIEAFRIYACLRQIHFQTISAKQGIDNSVLEQKGFFAGNKEQHDRMCKALKNLGLSKWRMPGDAGSKKPTNTLIKNHEIV